jgi:8-oxo-dGTP pyrophosphatase MutT (NUDIX family)
MAKQYFSLVSAVYVFLVQEDNILLLRRFQTGYEDGNYSVPAGHLDGEESVREAAIREAKEEAGITLTPSELEFVHVMHRLAPSRESVDWFFVVKQWEGEVTNCEPEKCDDLSWFPIHNLPSNTIPYILAAIQYWQDEIPFSEFGWE